MFRQHLCALATACAAVAASTATDAAMLQVHFDAEVGGGIGGNLKSFRATTVDLPHYDIAGNYQINLTVTGSTTPGKDIRLFVVELVTDPADFLADWDTYYYYDAAPLPGVPGDVRYSSTEHYFVISNQVSDTVIDLAALDLGPVYHVRITNVTKSHKPVNEVIGPGEPPRTYAQDLFGYALGQYAPSPTQIQPYSYDDILTTVPEPAVASLLLGGLLLLRRRRPTL